MANGEKEKANKIVDALTNKKFEVSWIDEVTKFVIIEAKDKEAAEEKFNDWDFDEDKIEIEDVSMNHHSTIIEELED